MSSISVWLVIGMMLRASISLTTEALIKGYIDECARLWDVPALSAGVFVVFSDRLRSSLGRTSPTSGRIVLSSVLLAERRDQLSEVLCHELAHLATYQRYGSAARAHGPEWSALVARAGYSACASMISVPDIRRAAAQSYPVLHTCPVCHTTRFARRRISRWRCAECVTAGLPGILETIRIAAPKSAIAPRSPE